MKELMNVNSGIAINEEIYLLMGDIPVERMYIIESNSVLGKIFDVKYKNQDIKSRLYFKSVNKDGSFNMNSFDESPYQDHYYFGYSEDDVEKFRGTFVGLREFLARASYVGRQYEPTTEYYVDTMYQGNALRLEELEAIENMHDPRLLICVLGNKALVKRKSVLTSGFEFIDSNDIPLVNEKYYKFVGEKEDLPFTHDDIVNGIKDDIEQNIRANFGGPSFN